jgi:RNA polymerase sigma-70 factor (sigma-E family)
MRADREREYVAYVEDRVLRLRRIGYHLCGSWHGAEDLVQETLIRLYQRWERVSTMASRDGYVRQILVSVYLDQTRRSWFRRMLPTSDPPERAAPAGASPDDRMDLMAALDQLPPGQRAVVVLRYLEGLDVTETATALRRSPGTVKSQTRAALANLRLLLPGYADPSTRLTS